MKVFVPGDAAAVACGADEVAAAIARESKTAKRDVQIVRNGSRGAHGVEPLVEVDTAQGRIGYGPLEASEIPDLIAAGMLDGKPHAKCIGKPEELPFLKKQTRLTFARCGITDPQSLDEYRALQGGKGLERANAIGPAAIVEDIAKSGLRGRGGAGFPTGIKWKTVADTKA